MYVLHPFPCTSFSFVNLANDFTNLFDRSNKGTVFPLTRAATMGYAFGDRRFDDGDCTGCSVCNQIAPDCQDGPHGKKGRSGLIFVRFGGRF